MGNPLFITIEWHRMEYITLGKSGLKVSRLCLGVMSFGTPEWRPWIRSEEEGRPIIRRALEEGVNFFDTADMYSRGRSEEILGRALKDFSRRGEVVIATKVFFPTGDRPNDQGLSRKHILDAVDASLLRLGTDYIDLYQIHRWDYQTPIEETMEVLHDLVRAGKVRYLGASSMYLYQFAGAQHAADRHGWTRFISMQNHYNLVYREEEREMIPYCRQEGIGIIPWSPLARGFLAGTRKKDAEAETPRGKMDTFAKSLYFQEADYAVLDRVVAVAAKKGVKPAQVALAWVLQQPGVTAPIIGATKMEHLSDAIASLAVGLDDGERAALEGAYVPHRVLGIDEFRR
jgi:aryl-alcohol dehydrogenase (NADP+)